MKRAPTLFEQRDDIQALIGSGFGSLTSSRFLLLTILDVSKAKAWLNNLLKASLIASVGELKEEKASEKQKRNEMASIAFSHKGLAKLGLQDSDDFPFATAFQSGMGSDLRAELLRDTEREDWSWRDVKYHGQEPVHVLIAHWWDASIVGTAQVPSTFPQLSQDAFSVHEVHGDSSFFRGPNNAPYEPFGFRDGIAQPRIYGLNAGNESDLVPDGLTPAQERMFRDQVTAPGEFICGYRNEYDQLSYCADAKGWEQSGLSPHEGGRFALNGSFLAVRQIEQDVAAFKKVTDERLGPMTCPAKVTLAEKLIGRRQDDHGTPLAWTGSACPVNDMEANLFRYRVEDQDGFLTPRGAHIRRVNPRDSLGHDVPSGIEAAKLHRLLRRGRPYVDTKSKPETQGLFFMACNVDLERQFEFIYQRWIQNPRFNQLTDENDPLLGLSSTPKAFTVQGLPSGEVKTMSTFTTTLGGGYFFLPGLSALKFICK